MVMTSANERFADSPAKRRKLVGRKREREAEESTPKAEAWWIAPVLGISVIVVVLVAWQVCASTGLVNPAFSSNPIAVARALAVYVTSSQFRSDAAHSGEAFIVGIVISIIAGVVIGALLGWYKYLRYSFDYAISFAYAAPRIALIPLIILWFGIGDQASVVVVVLLAIWPPMMNTTTAIRTIDTGFLDLGRSMKMSHSQLFRKVLLPAAIPSILTAVRLSIGLALIGVVVAEFLAGTQGIGYRISEAADNYQTALMFAGLVIVSVAGVCLTELVKLLEHHFDRWKT